MATYLLTWNPTKWNWESLPQDLQQFQTTGHFQSRWSCGQRTNITVGDRVFLLKQGPDEPRGIIASGRVASEVWQDEHFSDPDKQSNYIDVDFDVLLDPETQPLPRSELDRESLASMHWDPQGGGTEIPSPVDNALEQLWKQHVQELGITPTQIHRPPRKRRYWWVSQNRTGQQEVAGGYMWSPKTAAEGNRFFSYEFMKECAPGDIVFSFIDTAISTIGMVTGFCYESDKPDEFHAAGHAWVTEGWRVPVNFRPTAQAMRPADNMETLGPLLPTKYSPIQTTGRGNQAYLFPVPENLAQEILSLVGETPESVSTSVPVTDQADLADVTREDREQYELQRIDQDTSISETERTSLRKSRNGQQLFRQRVSEREPCCRVTGISNDEYRIASHIKPWSHSNNQERLDGNNGLLLAPHIDHLFDKGLISFGDDGALLISPAADIESLRQMAVPVDDSFNAGDFSEQQRVYLEYHRLEVFRRAAS